jgi:hypothetical protein
MREMKGPTQTEFDFSLPLGSRLDRKGGGLMAQTEAEIVQEIGSDYATKYGFANPDEAEAYFFKSGRGLSYELVEPITKELTLEYAVEMNRLIQMEGSAG